MARLLSLDLGERRIGVAVSDPTGTLARPLTTIYRASRREDFEAIAELVRSNEAKRIIVGLPFSLDGTEGLQRGLHEDRVPARHRAVPQAGTLQRLDDPGRAA